MGDSWFSPCSLPLVKAALSEFVPTAAIDDYFLIYQVGRGVAHDEYVEFSVQDNKIIYQERTLSSLS
jgi:hypothetical protein